MVSTGPDGSASSMPLTLDPTTFHIPAVFPPAPDVTSTEPAVTSTQANVIFPCFISLLARSSFGIEGSIYTPANMVSSTPNWNNISSGPAWSDVNSWGQAQYYSTIRSISVGGKIYVFGRSSAGIEGSIYDPSTSSWTVISAGPAWSDKSGWGQVQYYSTIQLVSLDEKIYLFGRSSAGITGSIYDPSTSSWAVISAGPAWSDKANWGNAEYYSTIQAVSVGGKIYLVARDGAGITGSVYDPTASSWTEISRGPTLSDPSWRFAQYYSTIRSVSMGERFIYLLEVHMESWVLSMILLFQSGQIF